MKITVTKIKRLLEKDYGYGNLNNESQKRFVDVLIKDVRDIIDTELRGRKNISIKK